MEHQFNKLDAPAFRNPSLLAPAALGLAITLTGIGCKVRSENPEPQIDKIRSELPELLKTATVNSAYTPGYRAASTLQSISPDEIIEDCFRTLALVGRVNEAIEAARRIEQAEEKSWMRYKATSAIIKSLTIAGRRDEARRIAREELEAAQKIEGVKSRSEATTWIVTELAEAGGSADAFEAARRIENASIRSKALVDVVKAMAKDGLTKEALDAARKIEDAGMRSSALSGIVEALADSGKTVEAKQTAREALDLARKLINSNFQATSRPPYDATTISRPLVNVFKALNKAGMSDEAEGIIGEALKPGIDHDHEHALSNSMQGLAKALAGAGHIKLALDAAQKVFHDRDRQWTRAEIVTTLAGDYKIAEALEVVSRIETPDLLDKALGEVIASIARIGNHPETLEAARKLEDSSSRSVAVVKAIAALIMAGKSLEAERAADVAIEAARKVEDVNTRNDSLVVVAWTLAEAGRTDKSLKVAREIEDSNARIKALLRVAEAITKGQERDRARGVIEEARRATNRINNDSDKSIAFAMVASGLAKLHLYRSAREAVERDVWPIEKVAAYTAILREYHLERDPGLSKLF